MIIPLIIERNGIILAVIDWNKATGLIPNLGKIKNNIIKINTVSVIGMTSLALPISLLEINKLKTK